MKSLKTTSVHSPGSQSTKAQDYQVRPKNKVEKPRDKGEEEKQVPAGRRGLGQHLLTLPVRPPRPTAQTKAATWTFQKL